MWLLFCFVISKWSHQRESNILICLIVVFSFLPCCVCSLLIQRVLKGTSLHLCCYIPCPHQPFCSVSGVSLAHPFDMVPHKHLGAFSHAVLMQGRTFLNSSSITLFTIKFLLKVHRIMSMRCLLTVTHLRSNLGTVYISNII